MLPRNKWLEFSKGVFHTVMVSSEPEIAPEPYQPKNIFWVKRPNETQVNNLDQLLADPKRAIAIWREINPTIPARLNPDNSWDTQYIAGYHPSDEDIARCLVDIYKRTRRIIVDGCNPRNFIKRYEDGSVICIDMDLALLWNNGSDRVSEAYLKTVVFSGGQIRDIYQGYFWGHEYQDKSIEVILNLLQLEAKRNAGITYVNEDITYERILGITPYRKGGLRYEISGKEIPQLNLIQEPVTNESTNVNSASSLLPDEKSQDILPIIPISTTQDIFLKLHKYDQSLFGRTKIKGNISETLEDIVSHAQNDRTRFGMEVRSATTIKKLGWFNAENKIVAGSALDVELKRTNEMKH